MNFTALLTAGRVVECNEITNVNYTDANGRPFSVCVVPASGSSLSAGDIVFVEGYLVRGSGAHPAVVGEWSPLVFNEFKAVKDLADNVLTLGTDYRIFAAPMTID